MKFSELNLHTSLMASVEASGFTDCTPIQSEAVPHILAGRDVAGLAQTGTGKTAAFVLPLMDRILRSRAAAPTAEPTSESAGDATSTSATASDTAPASTDGVAYADVSPEEEARQVEESLRDPAARPIFKNWRRSNFILVLVPTRELAEQVSDNVKKFGARADMSCVAVYGGVGYEPQKEALKKGVDFVVATPGRLIDLYKEHLVDLHQVRAVVFDEADRMFDMGFKDDMKFILRRVPRERQFLVFSATLNFDVLTTAYEFGANPVEVNVSKDQAKAENVADELFYVGRDEKPKYLLSLFKKFQPKQAIVFSNFRSNVNLVAKFLTDNGYPAMGISSLLTQAQRQKIMDQFKAQNEMNILVATDLAARGLDIKGVDMVVNYELPDDPENYVHRIGRTGRAGEKGRAYSLSGDRDVEAMSRIEDYLGHKVPVAWLEDAELVTEFKAFPRERGEDRPFRPRAGGGRPPPRGGGGGGYQRDRGDRPQGRRHENRPEGRSGEGRPYEGRRPDTRHGEGRPHEGRPQQSRGGGGYQRDRGDRPQDGRRPEGQGRHGEGRPQQSRGGGGYQRDRGDRPRGSGEHQGKSQHGQHRHGGGRHHPPSQRQHGGKSYTHRPSASAKPQAGVVNKVTGFIKSLFGKKKAKS